MNLDSIGFIGGGNMTRAIVAGLLDDGYAAENIAVSEPFDAQRESLGELFPEIFVSADNDDIVARSKAVVLAVKPQIIAKVCRTLAGSVQRHRPLIISIAAGPRIEDIDTWLGGDNAIARVMPNQPALLRKGISGLYANSRTSAEQRTMAENVMQAVGPVVTVAEEADIDAVTAVSGSGPAYFYLLIDMIANSAIEFGLDANAAAQLARETALGAATLAHASDEDMATLISRVRSPGGTTAAALDSLEEEGIRDIVSRALLAARDRATELADLAHEDKQE